MVKSKIVTDNVVEDISKLKTKSKKHRYYSEEIFTAVKNKMLTDDPYLHFAAEVVYYLYIRSEKELSLLQVKNIIQERKQVLIEPEASKADSRYIPIPDEMMQVFEERKIFDHPPDHYVFSVSSKNKFVKDGSPGAEPFNRGFFSKGLARSGNL